MRLVDIHLNFWRLRFLFIFCVLVYFLLTCSMHGVWHLSLCSNLSLIRAWRRHKLTVRTIRATVKLDLRLLPLRVQAGHFHAQRIHEDVFMIISSKRNFFGDSNSLYWNLSVDTSCSLVLLLRRLGRRAWLEIFRCWSRDEVLHPRCWLFEWWS